MSFTLPSLAKGGASCWTECPILTPHHKDKKARDFTVTFYGREILPRETIYNIARFGDSEHAPKGPSRWERAGRSEWIGNAKTQKQLDAEAPARNQPRSEPKPLAPVKREAWPRIL
jgi:hypothetical protein